MYENGMPLYKKTYYDNGAKKIIIDFTEGKCEKYYPNGNIFMTYTFYTEKKVSDDNDYNSEIFGNIENNLDIFGNIENDSNFVIYLDGKITIYNSNQNVIETRHYSKGKKIGKWIIYSNDGSKIIRIEKYKNGKLQHVEDL